MANHRGRVPEGERHKGLGKAVGVRQEGGPHRQRRQHRHVRLPYSGVFSHGVTWEVDGNGCHRVVAH